MCFQWREITLLGQENPMNNDDVKLQLHKEKLEVSKKWIDTTNVKVYKNTYTEEKLITVPITREELVIEKKELFEDGTVDKQAETIRIPLSVEQIKVTKYPVILENVEVYKNQFEDIIHIQETLKKEKVRIETIGDPKVVDERE